MRKINPGLFARLMRLPETARTDLLEFIGATPVADSQLAAMIDSISAKMTSDRKAYGIKSN